MNPPPSDPRPPYARRQFMLDQALQGQLLFRITFYWLLFMTSGTLAVWAWQYVIRQAPALPLGTIGLQLLPAYGGSLFVLPWVWSDTLRWSNRFVGPVHSLRLALRRLERGDAVAPLKVRDGDQWTDLADGFNRIVTRLPAAQDSLNPPASRLPVETH